MHTVITSSDNTISAQFDRRFGRAAWFCLFDQKTKQIEFIKNQYRDSANDAGIKSAYEMIKLKVNKIISGDFGPKVQDFLQKSNIQLVILPDSDFTIEQIISKLEHK